MLLPRVEVRPAQGARPSTAAVRPTDLGLGEVARSLEGWSAEVEETRVLEEAVARRDAEETVRPILENFQTEADAEFNQQGADWDGTTPGFARGAMSRLAERRTGFGGELPLTAVERDALDRGLNLYTEGTSQRAIQFEAQKRGGLMAQAAAARQGAAVSGAIGTYMSEFGAVQAELDASYDGSTDDYVARSLANHDQVAAALLERTPDALKPSVQQALTNQRLQLQGRTMDVEARSTAAFVTGQVRGAIDQSLNGLQSNPGLYEQFVASIDGMVSTLPANLQGAERARALDQGTDVYLDGLIRGGDEDQALALLNGGTLDSRLSPETKSRLLDAATKKRDEPDADDYSRQIGARQLMQDNLASLARSGEEVPGSSPADLADDLSEAELAEYTANIEAARRLHAATPTLSAMTPAELDAHREAQRPQPGTPGYAEAVQRFEIVERQVAAEKQARAEDPGGWAIAASPQLRTYLEGMGDPDANVRRRNASAFAAASLGLQNRAGIAPAQQRLFSKGAAAGIVASAEGDADPVRGIQGYASWLDAFETTVGDDPARRASAGAMQKMVVRELLGAGAEASDLAAADMLAGGAPRGAYAAGDRTAWAGLDDDAREGLTARVDRSLRDYFASRAGDPQADPLSQGRRDMAYKLAAGRMATREGTSADQAAAWAAQQIAGQYDFVGRDNLRVPDAVAAGAFATRVGARGPEAVTGADAVAFRLNGIVTGFAANDAAGFWDPGGGNSMTAAQRRRLYASQVQQNGRWVTRADDGGADFVYRDNTGRFVQARDAAGHQIGGTWSQLMAGQTGGSQPQPPRPSPRPAASRPGDQSQPHGIRLNNPGNLRPDGSRWQGMTGVHRTPGNGEFVRFATPEAGIRALTIDLGTKYRRGLTSVRSIIGAYAPPEENDTRSYIATVARSLGVDPGARLNLNDARVRQHLVTAIIQHENGQQPFSAATIGRVVREVLAR